MKKIILIMAIIFISASVYAKDVTVSFTWDPNTESTMAGYALFQREGLNPYNYDNPLDPSCTIVSGGCYTHPDTLENKYSIVLDLTIPAVTNVNAVFNKTAGTIDFTWTQTVNSPVTYSWVARAKDTSDQWSEDSDEVSKTFDLGVTHWKLYQSQDTPGNWSEILDIPWDGSSTLISASIPAETLAPGTIYYFTVVGFTVDEIFSPNSQIVEIDRKPPTKVINLKITLVE